MGSVALWLLAAALLPLARPAGALVHDPAGLEGWPLYADPAAGYSVRYPPGWEARLAFENAPGAPYLIRRRVGFVDPEGTQIAIDVWEREAGLPLEQWLREVEQITAPVESNAAVSGQDAWVLVQAGGSGAPAVLATYVAFGDWVYKIHHQYAGDAASLAVYEGMLRSFELAGVGPAAQRPTALPDLSSMIPATCDTNICPSTCTVYMRLPSGAIAIPPTKPASPRFGALASGSRVTSGSVRASVSLPGVHENSRTESDAAPDAKTRLPSGCHASPSHE
jgi:hypothetical protein